MAIPWLIGAAAVVIGGAVGAVVADSVSSSSSSDDEEDRAKRQSEQERKQKEKDQVALQNIARLEQAVDLLKSSYGVDEAEALRLLNPDEDVEYMPEALNSALDDAKLELKLVKKALKSLEEVENEL